MRTVGALGVERVALPRLALSVFFALGHEGQQGCAAAGASLSAATRGLALADALPVGRALFVALGEALGAAVAGAWLEVAGEALARDVVTACEHQSHSAQSEKLHARMVGEAAQKQESHALRQMATARGDR
jgi:hypothetical protein